MHAPTLLLTLTTLLVTAALPSGPSIPNLRAGPNLGCQRIDAHAFSRRDLSETADSTIDTAAAAAAALPDSVLAPRVLPGHANACGILRGGQRSDGFPLNPNYPWSAYWVNDRLVVDSIVLLWELGGNADHTLQRVPMYRQQITASFTPVAGRQYALELWGPPTAVMSWYFATQ